MNGQCGSAGTGGARAASPAQVLRGARAAARAAGTTLPSRRRAARHFRRRPRRACGSVRESVYFRPPPPPRAEGRACPAAGAAGSAQPWTGSWGESGGRAPGPESRGRGRGRGARRGRHRSRASGCGRRGLGRRGASPRGRGAGHRAGSQRGRELGPRGPAPLRAGRAARGPARAGAPGAGARERGCARPAEDRRPRRAVGLRGPAQVGPATPRRGVSGVRGGRARRCPHRSPRETCSRRSNLRQRTAPYKQGEKPRSPALPNPSAGLERRGSAGRGRGVGRMPGRGRGRRAAGWSRKEAPSASRGWSFPAGCFCV